MLTVEERRLVVRALRAWSSMRYEEVTGEVFDDDAVQRGREEQYHADMRVVRSAMNKLEESDD